MTPLQDKTLAVIRVFTHPDADVLQEHARIVERLYGLSTRTYCIADQPGGIPDEETAALCVDRIVERCVQAEKDGADAILISCAIDPGVAEARRACRIPVFGAGSCAAAMALCTGERVGVLSLVPGSIPSVPRAMLGDRLVATRAVAGVKDTRDLLTDWGREGARRCVLELAREVDVIMFSCTGFSTMGIAHWFPEIDVPIVDAIEAAGAAAYRHLASISATKRSA